MWILWLAGIIRFVHLASYFEFIFKTHLSFRFQVQCCPDQDIISATVAWQTFYPSLPYQDSTITRVAWSHRLSPFLKGKFQVISVPADHQNISIKFSRQNVLPITFPPGNPTKLDVKSRVYDLLMERLKVTMKDQGLVFKEVTVPQFSMDICVHAECTLLAYHVRHPTRATIAYRYFGGSKLSCHGCSTFFYQLQSCRWIPFSSSVLHQGLPQQSLSSVGLPIPVVSRGTDPITLQGSDPRYSS